MFCAAKRDGFLHWSKCNLLPINYNYDKCLVTSKTNKNAINTHTYIMNPQTLSRVTSFKDLGVTFDFKRSFSRYIYHIVTETLNCMRFIIRSSSCFQNINTLNDLFYVLSTQVLHGLFQPQFMYKLLNSNTEMLFQIFHV